jgi:hypothetical protein
MRIIYLLLGLINIIKALLTNKDVEIVFNGTTITFKTNGQLVIDNNYFVVNSKLVFLTSDDAENAIAAYEQGYEAYNQFIQESINRNALTTVVEAESSKSEIIEGTPKRKCGGCK